MALISVLGLYQYDNTIFDNLKLPEGVDRETVIDNILFSTAELEVLFANPETLKSIIGVWSSKKLDSWKRIFTALTEEYNALHNFDRYEVIKENVDTARDNVHSSKANATVNSSADDKSFDSVSAYNNSGFTDKDKTVSESSGSSSSSGSNTDTIKDNEQVSRGAENHLFGNIGITTSQQMLDAEIKLRTVHNIADIITRDFKNQFCILVY